MNLYAADGVRIDKDAGHYAITTDVYTARVDTNGTLASIVVEGIEFLAPPMEINWENHKVVAPGLHARPMHQWFNPYDPATVQEQSNNVIRCEGNGWKLEYAFLPDAIELTWEGTPTGGFKTPNDPAKSGRGFQAGYPAAELVLSLAHDLDRACDPGNQGELGWPVKRKHEPGSFSVLAKNGAGFTAENASWFWVVGPGDTSLLTPPHRLDELVFNADYNIRAQPEGPVRRRLKLFRKADLAHSVTLEIQPPNRQHLFSKTDEVVFTVRVHTLYGQKLKGAVQFQGAPYVWKTPELTSETPVEVGADGTATVSLKIRPPKPGQYTGVIRITDGQQPIYSQRLGFMFRPEEIPAAVAPPDFDEFWAKTLAELDKVPLDLTLEEQKDKETPAGHVYKAQYRSWGGRWAWAWLYVPKADGKFPAKVACPAVSVWQPGAATPADGTLRIAVAVHGGDLKDFPAKPDFDYMNTGITDRETYMLRYSYCCLARCFDIIKLHAKCNGEISIEGGSQGAGLSLVLAGLRTAKQAQGVAVALCRIDWTVLGYTQWGPHAPAGTDPKQIAEVVRYYDPASFAHRIHTPLKYAIGLFDFCAPAEGIFTAFNALPKDTPCQVFVDPYGGHFTIDAADFYQGTGIIPIPRWQGTDADNKLAR